MDFVNVIVTDYAESVAVFFILLILLVIFLWVLWLIKAINGMCNSLQLYNKFLLEGTIAYLKSFIFHNSIDTCN